MKASSTSKTLNNKLISIIIPIFNREKTLNRLFQSLLRIEYQSIELILIDNNSKDRSLELCHQFKANHSKKFYSIIIEMETTPGACACRNHGTRLANGEYLFFFDSDDEVSSDFFADLAPFLPYYDVVCAPTLMRFPDGSKKVRSCIPTAAPYDHILSASLSTQSFMIRKDFMTSIEGWDEQLARWNDWELGVRILCHQPRLKWVTGKAYHTIYQHQQSISGKSYTEDYENLIKSLSKAEEDIRASSLIQRVKDKSYNSLYCKHLLLSINLYKETDKAKAKACYDKGAALRTSLLLKYVSPLIYFLGKHKCPGTWRMFRWFI